jgi:hypothetical protein
MASQPPDVGQVSDLTVLASLRGPLSVIIRRHRQSGQLNQPRRAFRTS